MFPLFPNAISEARTFEFYIQNAQRFLKKCESQEINIKIDVLKWF